MSIIMPVNRLCIVYMRVQTKHDSFSRVDATHPNYLEPDTPCGWGENSNRWPTVVIHPRRQPISTHIPMQQTGFSWEEGDVESMGGEHAESSESDLVLKSRLQMLYDLPAAIVHSKNINYLIVDCFHKDRIYIIYEA